MAAVALGDVHYLAARRRPWSRPPRSMTTLLMAPYSRGLLPGGARQQDRARGGASMPMAKVPVAFAGIGVSERVGAGAVGAALGGRNRVLGDVTLVVTSEPKLV